jgi:hypothetical protein
MEKNQRKTYGGRKMKTIIKASWILTVALALAIPVSGVAKGGEKGAPDSSGMDMQEQRAPADVRSNSHDEQQKDSQDKSKEKGLTKPANMPIYKPPLRGAPAGRVAGGTRGPNEKFPYLCLLVPEHVGLTTNAQPSLYYFVSQSTSCPVEFVLLKKGAVYPLVETRIQSPKQSGIHAIYLSDYGARLKKGIQYRWFVALVPDAQHRSKDVLAAGAIEFIDMPHGLSTELQSASEGEAPSIYAEAGIWYDALAALSALIEKKPEYSDFRKERASLLDQVGLARAAEYETKRGEKSGD